ncbi:hypothetical protein AVEN_39445-1 [Araneus ventricosus]|uniref:Uncharacterized protein n=1 Tax=Araneus ventricosus TaxID=182803 RepID=A0A4Y2SQ15_ARAVE|nr:hypothetical protein AVEN_39445-1 [Araneus ventricosus]
MNVPLFISCDRYSGIWENFAERVPAISPREIGQALGIEGCICDKYLQSDASRRGKPQSDSKTRRRRTKYGPKRAGMEYARKGSGSAEEKLRMRPHDFFVGRILKFAGKQH